MSDVVSPTIDPVSVECASSSSSSCGWQASLLHLWSTKKYWIIGGIVLLVFLISIGVWYYRKKKRQAEKEKTSFETKKKSSRRESLRKLKLPTKSNEKQKEVIEKKIETQDEKTAKTEKAEKMEENPQPTENDFNTGVQLLDRTVKGFKDAFSDFEKTYQSMTEEHISLEQQQKLTGKIEYILNFLRTNATHVVKLGQMLYRDAKVLEKSDEWIQEHIEVKVEYVQDHFEQALQMIQQISSTVEEEEQPSRPSGSGSGSFDQELEVVLEEEEHQG